MKFRLFIILTLVIAGMIAIEIYFRSKEEPDYLFMNYEIKYQEKQDNPEKLLINRGYFSYYFVHYDPDAYILFANGDKFSISDAINNNYIFLGDLIKKVNIEKRANFTLAFTENIKQDLARKYYVEQTNIYYYHLNDIQLILDNKKENLLDLIASGDITINMIMDYLDELVKEKEISKEEKDDYLIYKGKNYKIIIKDKNIYFGNKDLKNSVLDK